MNKPIFIGKLTSGFLLERAKMALKHSYKSNSYIERYNYQPLALETFGNKSECIDLMLTKPQYKLSDFLYSVFNTNEKTTDNRKNSEQTQLFDSKQMRKSCTIKIDGILGLQANKKSKEEER